MYFQAFFIFDRIKALAPQHPEWKDKEPFASVLKGDVKAALAGGEHALARDGDGHARGHDHRGVRRRSCTDWIATAKHPKTGRLYTEMVYQPMLELLAYLRANGFKTFIVSGGGIEFMRPWAERVYGIPPEQVIGSSIKTKFEMRDGKPVLVRLPEIDFVDDKAPASPSGIQMHIGRRPIAAFGNSDGDLQMLQWTAAGSGTPLLPLRPPHRRRARVGLRPPVVGRPPRQGPRRGAGEGLDGRGHEDGLEADLPVQLGDGDHDEGVETPAGRGRGRPLDCLRDTGAGPDRGHPASAAAGATSPRSRSSSRRTSRSSRTGSRCTSASCPSSTTPGSRRTRRASTRWGSRRTTSTSARPGSWPAARSSRTRSTPRATSWPSSTGASTATPNVRPGTSPTSR